jgi:hypothetical protein
VRATTRPPVIASGRFEASDGHGDRSDAALEHALALVEAAHVLGLDFALTTEHTAEFRHGGNVNKAHITTYVVKVTEAAKPDEPA